MKKDECGRETFMIVEIPEAERQTYLLRVVTEIPEEECQAEKGLKLEKALEYIRKRKDALLVCPRADDPIAPCVDGWLQDRDGGGPCHLCNTSDG